MPKARQPEVNAIKPLLARAAEMPKPTLHAAVDGWRQLGLLDDTHHQTGDAKVTRKQNKTTPKQPRSILAQTNLHGENITYQDAKESGDILGKKQNNRIRIGFQNISGMPATNTHYKSIKFLQLLNEYDFDIFGISEVNLNWSKVNKRINGRKQ